MKSALRILVVALLLLAPVAAPAEWMSLTTSSGQIIVAPVTADHSSSVIAVSGPAAFYGIAVKTDGTNNVRINVYDNTALGGTTLIPADTVIPGAARTWTFSWTPPVKCTTGIYVEISVDGGGTALWKVQYDK